MTQCWKCGDMDAEFQKKCNVPACGMKEQKEQHPWRGLTDEEILRLWGRTYDRVSFARAIEAKLKEKNFTTSEGFEEKVNDNTNRN